MFLAALILIVSTALLLFYLQAICQRILRRQFNQEYYQVIVNANRLEFLAIRQGIEKFDTPVDYARVRMTLKCDFLALTYLLKNAANARQRYSRQEWLLILYFRATLFWLFLRQALRLQVTPAVLRLTTILQYFANVVGERVSMIRFGNLSASDYLLNL